jgi:uncharacterized protein (TIGR00369 family)
MAMARYVPSDPEFEPRVRASFKRQELMTTFAAQMTRVVPGEVRIELPFNHAFTQQHGYIHAGVLTSIVDSACGYAAYTLMPADSNVLTVEYKVNFLNPARGELFIGIGRVVKAGRTLTVCNGEVWAVDGTEEKLIATMQTTMMAITR